MSEKLEKRYGFSVAVSMVVGIVIGIGIFFKAEQILRTTAMNPKIAIAAWIIGGIISILAGLTAAEVGAAIPETGGMVAWIKKIYGEKMAFIVGWAYMVLYLPALAALIGYYFALFTGNFLGIQNPSTSFIFPVALVAITFLYLVNIFTASVGGKIQSTATFIKLIPLGLITIFGLFFADSNPLGAFYMTPQAIEVASEKSSIVLLGLALVPIMFAFDGWILVGTIAGDLKNVKRDLPKSIIFGLGFITVFYALLNIGLLKVFPAEELVQKGIFGVAAQLFGANGSKFIFLGIMISAFGGLNGIIMSSTRIPYSLAIEGHLPCNEFFAQVDPKSKQPKNSSFLAFIVTLIYIALMYFSGQVDAFGDVPVSIFWLFYCLVFYGLFILRKREPNLERPYVVPFYPVIPALALIGGFSVFVYSTISNPKYMAISLVLCAVGALVYRKKVD